MKTKLKFLLPALLGTAVAAPFASAQTAYTDPVGAVVVPVPAGTSVLSIPFQHPKLFQGAASSVSGTTIDIGSTVSITPGLYYIQVVSGVAAGEFMTISAASGSTLTLENAISGLQAGDVVSVRKHFVVSDLQNVPDFTSITLLNGNNPVSVAENIFGWDNPNLPIFPGEGLLINTGSGFDLTITGSVSVDDVVVALPAGTSVIGTLDPVNGAEPVIQGLSSSFPDFTSLTEVVSGVPVSYDYFFGSWSSDLSNIDFSNFKTVLVNSGFPVEYVLSGYEF